MRWFAIGALSLTSCSVLVQPDPVPTPDPIPVETLQLRGPIIQFGVLLGGASQRLIPYPEESGAVLGQGWNSISESPADATCLKFQAKSYDYQDREISLSRVVDQEALTVILEYSAKASAKAKLKVFSGGASGSTYLKNRYHTDSSRTTYIVDAKVTHGSDFVAPPADVGGDGFVVLSDKANEWIDDGRPQTFVQTCGDSFVAAIVKGARVRAVYQAHATNFENRLQIEHKMSANASYLGFGGKAEMGIKLDIENSEKVDKYSLSFYQDGGAGGLLPTDEATLTTVIQGLPGVASEAPKPLGLVVRPYSSLSTWPSVPTVQDLTIEEAVSRYYLRLRSLLGEVFEIERDWNLNGKADSEGRVFAFKIDRDLRGKPLREIRDGLMEEIRRTESILNSIGEETPCYSSTKRSASNEYIECYVSAASPLLKFSTEDKSTGAMYLDLDDFKWAIWLPVPRNGFPTFIYNQIKAGTITGVEAQMQYAWFVYRFRVYRTIINRCELFGECLPHNSRRKLFQDVYKTFPELEQFTASRSDDLFDAMSAELPEWQLDEHEYLNAFRRIIN